MSATTRRDGGQRRSLCTPQVPPFPSSGLGRLLWIILHPSIQQLGDMESNSIKLLIIVIVLLYEVKEPLLWIYRTWRLPQGQIANHDGQVGMN